MKGIWARIDETVQRFYAPWTDIPAHSLMVSGAQQALYAVIEKIDTDNMARVRAGKRPQHMALVDWLNDEVTAMLAADEARVKAKVSVGERSR